MIRIINRALSVALLSIMVFGAMLGLFTSSIYIQPVKICLVGNSHLFSGNFGDKLIRIAQSKGHAVKIIDLTIGGDDGMITNQLNLLKTDAYRLKKLRSADIVILQLRAGYKPGEYGELLSFLDDDVKVYASGEPTAYLSCLNSAQLETFWNEWKNPSDDINSLGTICKIVMPIDEVFTRLSRFSASGNIFRFMNKIADSFYNSYGWIFCTGEYYSFHYFRYAQTRYGVTDFNSFASCLERTYNTTGVAGYRESPELCFKTLSRIKAFIPNGYIFDKLIYDYHYNFFDIRSSDSSAHATELGAYAFALAANSIIFGDSPVGSYTFLTNHEYSQLTANGIRSTLSREEAGKKLQVQVNEILKDYKQKMLQLSYSVEFNSKKGYFVKKADSVLQYVY